MLGFAFVRVRDCQGAGQVCMSTLPAGEQPYTPHQSREKTWSDQCSAPLLFTIGPTSALMLLLVLTDCFCSVFASVVMEEDKTSKT